MKVKLILSLCASFLAAFMLLFVLPVNGEEKIYTDMIRLHVIANSDTDEDQSLKLKVRDAVLTVVEKMTPDNREEAEKNIADNKEEILEAAKEVIAENGYSYPVTMELGTEKYPEREYDGFTLPAGRYRSLRIIIGEGKGHNWWCVLYPPLCRTAAEKREETFIAAGFTEEQYRTITESGKTRYKVKFKILELISELFESGK